MKSKIVLTLIGLFMSVTAIPITLVLGKYLTEYLQVTSVPILKPIMLSMMAVGVILMAIGLGHILLNRLIHFHKRHNTSNLDINPVKFAIANQINIEKLITIAMITLLIFMLYGIWLGS